MALKSPMDMKYSNCALETDQFHLKSDLITSKAFCLVNTSNLLQNYYNVALIFHRFLIITVEIIYIHIFEFLN